MSATANPARSVQCFIVTTEPPRLAGKEPVLKRWAVLADNSDQAAEIVRARVAPECIVTVTDEELPDDRASEINLQFGHAVAL